MAIALKFLTSAVAAEISAVDLARLFDREFEQIAEVWITATPSCFAGRTLVSASAAGLASSTRRRRGASCTAAKSKAPTLRSPMWRPPEPHGPTLAANSLCAVRPVREQAFEAFN